MSSQYNPSTIEFKWQKIWQEKQIYKAQDPPAGGPKKYILIEFAYPSGERLHVGHGRSYTAFDVVSRYYRMKGFNVLYPMGWDAFGLPAENYAIKTGVNPQITTQKNIANAKKQALDWGLSFDWSREVNTTDPKYYKWTQWIFLQLYKNGLAYKAQAAINWCPFCKTNLANEEVLADGTHERCGNMTERRMQNQWILKITQYADRLLEDLEKTDYWPKVKEQQRNWIGKSEGIKINFKVEVEQGETFNPDRIGTGAKPRIRQQAGTKGGLTLSEIEVFTKFPETIFGVTYLVLAPEHALVWEILNNPNFSYLPNLPAIRQYVEQAKQKVELERLAENKEKSGVFTGIYVINPVNGQKVPVWVADYALATVGTGAVMGVPAHDTRDWLFAKKYDLPIEYVISPLFPQSPLSPQSSYEGPGLMINSAQFNGLNSKEAKPQIISWLIENKWAQKATTYHLRDWVFSRQHYWGEPIPMVYCDKCGWVPIPEKDLPLELPYVEKYQPLESGESPLAAITDWVNTTCPNCGGLAKRETDTMPNWAGSNWYFMRYTDPFNDQVLADPGKLSYWLPVDWYNGGWEHVTLHLLYSRFIYKFLFDIGAAPTTEPYTKRTCHGVILGPDGRRMSKSRGNVINPDQVIAKYGADTFRGYEMFIGPFAEAATWDDRGVAGVYRFLNKLHGHFLAQKERGFSGAEDPISTSNLNRLIKKVEADILDLGFNTAVAVFMEFTNSLDVEHRLTANQWDIYLRLLAPFFPHLAEELWQRLREECLTLQESFDSVHQQSWPQYNPDHLKEEKMTIVVQVNGKVRAVLQDVDPTLVDDQPALTNQAQELPAIRRLLADQKINRTVYVKGKLINFVTASA